MSKFKNISLIPYNKNGYSLFFIIDNLGKRDPFFDFFVNNLIERRYAKNTVQLYSIAVASLLDYLIEAIEYYEKKSVLIDGYKLSQIISMFPLFLSSGTKSSNEFIQQVALKLNAIPKTGSTEETYIAGINKYLSVSEDFHQRINELKDVIPNFEYISNERLFPNIGKKEKIPSFEKFNITKNNMLSSVISGGAVFKRLSALKKTKRTQQIDKDENLKIFPIDKSLDILKNSKNQLERALISLLSASGIRLSEALLLTFDDINVIDKEISINNPHNKTLEDYWDFFTYEEKQQLPFKSRSTKYTFLISPYEDYFWESLLRYIKEERRTSNNHPFIFTNEDGNPLLFNDKKFTQRFRTLSKKTTGTIYSPHSLRHMYVSYLVNYFPTGNDNYGLAVHQVQKLVGHTNINSTQIYVHNDLSILREKQKQYFDKLNKEDSILTNKNITKVAKWTI